MFTKNVYPRFCFSSCQGKDDFGDLSTRLQVCGSIPITSLKAIILHLNTDIVFVHLYFQL
jgi:hypothetical protein